MTSQLSSITSPSRTVPGSPAFDALPGSVRVCSQRTRESRVMKPFAAGGFHPIMRAGSTAKVGSTGHRLEMVGVDAATVAAKVIEVDRAIKYAILSHIEGSMGKAGPKEPSTHFPVSVSIQRARPYPALPHDSEPGPVVNERACCRSGGSLTSIMLLTETTLQSTANTFRIVNCAHRFHGCTLHQNRR